MSITTTLSLGALAIAWGFCNYGFITYIPTMLTETSESVSFVMFNQWRYVGVYDII